MYFIRLYRIVGRQLSLSYVLHQTLYNGWKTTVTVICTSSDFIERLEDNCHCHMYFIRLYRIVGRQLSLSYVLHQTLYNGWKTTVTVICTSSDFIEWLEDNCHCHMYFIRLYRIVGRPLSLSYVHHQTLYNGWKTTVTVICTSSDFIERLEDNCHCHMYFIRLYIMVGRQLSLSYVLHQTS